MQFPGAARLLLLLLPHFPGGAPAPRVCLPRGGGAAAGGPARLSSARRGAAAPPGGRHAEPGMTSPLEPLPGGPREGAGRESKEGGQPDLGPRGRPRPVVQWRGAAPRCGACLAASGGVPVGEVGAPGAVRLMDGGWVGLCRGFLARQVMGREFDPRGKGSWRWGIQTRHWESRNRKNHGYSGECLICAGWRRAGVWSR